LILRILQPPVTTRITTKRTCLASCKILATSQTYETRRPLLVNIRCSSNTTFLWWPSSTTAVMTSSTMPMHTFCFLPQAAIFHLGPNRFSRVMLVVGWASFLINVIQRGEHKDREGGKPLTNNNMPFNLQDLKGAQDAMEQERSGPSPEVVQVLKEVLWKVGRRGRR
jgi:hypothetical protein